MHTRNVPNEDAQLYNAQDDAVDGAAQLALAQVCKVDKVEDGLEGGDGGLERGGEQANLLANGARGFVQELGKHRMAAVLAVRQDLAEHQVLVVVGELIVEVNDLHLAHRHVRGGSAGRTRREEGHSAVTYRIYATRCPLLASPAHSSVWCERPWRYLYVQRASRAWYRRPLCTFVGNLCCRVETPGAGHAGRCFGPGLLVQPCGAK